MLSDFLYHMSLFERFAPFTTAFVLAQSGYLFKSKNCKK
ncbi:hypothetical protein CZ794_10885 [Psychrobacter sp. JB385]|nr:hypothetical protein CZ794_10885 [Psychrobacter sp. JB385]